MRSLKWIVGVVAVAVVLVVGGTWVFINLVQDDAPDRLAISPEEGDTADTSGPVELAGTWTTTNGSVAGYRVKEVLFGQSTEAVGRTEDVTGSVTVDGTTVTKASFEVDMTTVKSDQSRRDNQFQGRIMDTAQFPTATFALTSPIELGDGAAKGEVVSTAATGDLTLRGTTKAVTIDLEAKQTGGTFEVVGSLPIVFGDWGIPNPSNPAASVGDDGLLELKLVLAKG